MENDLEIWEMAKIFGLDNGARLKYLTAISWKWLTKGLNMFEMTYIFGNWLKCLRNGYLGNDVDLWEMAQICGEMT